MQRIRSTSPSAIAVVFPSDHQLGDAVIDQIRVSEPLSQKYLVTFGVRPTTAHTEYGYIRSGRSLGPGSLVDAFREKPDAKTAEELVKAGHLWNSGIFLLSVEVFFKELWRYCPKLFASFDQGSSPVYADLESIFIDYGLLEHSKKVAVVPLDAAWSDLGTFRALYDVDQHDANDNAGKAEYLSSKNNFVHAPGKHVGLIGVKNLIVVDTADALLVCDNQHTEQVKDLVERYNADNNPVAKYPRQVYRSWGSNTVLELLEVYKIKRLSVKPGQKLSRQLHHHRSEHWVVVSGNAEVELDGETMFIRKGESTFIRSGIKHRLRNPGVIPLEVIEVQLGEYLEEDDILRFEDDYGRD
jgi:mannose-1-phosphate guanylyltransferase / mannose-6-phosphate isomerase